MDASAAIEPVPRTRVGRQVEVRIFGRGEDVHAPHLVDVEVARVLRRLASSGTDPLFCRAALEDWISFGAIRYPHAATLSRMWELRANFSAHDAAYIAPAEALKAPMITHEGKLAAPGHRAAVEVF